VPLVQYQPEREKAGTPMPPASPIKWETQFPFDAIRVSVYRARGA